MSSSIHNNDELSQRIHASLRHSHNGTTTADVGLVLLDSFLKLVYCNPEALRIFAYASTRRTTRVSSRKVQKLVQSIIADGRRPEDASIPSWLISGRRRYLCRHFGLSVGSNGAPSRAITIERDRASQSSGGEWC
jgi:hypothetical protein